MQWFARHNFIQLGMHSILLEESLSSGLDASARAHNRVVTHSTVAVFEISGTRIIPRIWGPHALLV